MATYIKDLKEDNGDIVYPHTNTDAVYTSGGETLETRISKYVTAEDVASSVQSFGTVTSGMIDDDAITTAKIDDGAVTTAKLDDDAVTNAKIATGAVKSQNIDYASLVGPLFKTGSMPAVNNTTIPTAWTNTNLGTSVTVSGLEPTGEYTVIATLSYTESAGGEFRLAVTGANTTTGVSYNSNVNLTSVSFTVNGCQPSQSGTLSLQRIYRGDAGTARCGVLGYIIIRAA